MIKQFDKLIHFSEVISKLEKGLSLFCSTEYPFTSYFGINYSVDNIESIKFYFVTFQRVHIEQLLSFFPFANKIKHIYETYSDSKIFDIQNLGVTFAVKVDSKGNFSYSFYQKQDRTLPETKISLPIKEIPERGVFYVKEYNNKREFEKNYYFLSEQKNIEVILNLFKISHIISDSSIVQHIEYAEFEKKQKMVLVMYDYDYRTKFIRTSNNSNLLDLLDYLIEKYGVQPDFPGYYLNSNIKTLYFFDRAKEENFLHQSNTIQKLLER